VCDRLDGAACYASRRPRVAGSIDPLGRLELQPHHPDAAYLASLPARTHSRRSTRSKQTRSDSRGHLDFQPGAGCQPADRLSIGPAGRSPPRVGSLHPHCRPQVSADRPRPNLA
jgi:hypothetical protein